MVEARSALKMSQSPARSAAAWVRARAQNALLAVLALAGIALVLANTRLGAFLSDDTYYYISPARDLLAGKGFHPSYIFAPLFPLALAGLSLLGIEVLAAARWLNAILFGVNVFLVGRVAQRAGAPAGFALLASALVLLADVVIEAHGWAMSEALSFTFLLLALDGTLAYLATHKRRFWWLAAGAAALATLARYAAAPLAGAIALALLLFAPGKNLLQRAKNALLFGLVSIAPVAVYWLRNQLVSGHPVRYERFLFEPMAPERVVWFIYNGLSLFVPGRFLRGREMLAGAAALLASAALIAGLGWFYRKQWRRLDNAVFQRGVVLLATLLGLTLLMLYLARGLTELDVYNPRYLVPLLIVFLILVPVLAGKVWVAAGRGIRAALLVFFTLFLAYYAYRTYDFTRQTMRSGLGYSNAGWHDSETVPYLRAHPEMVDLVSTGEMGIYFWTGRMPKVLAYFKSPADMQAYLCTSGATLFLMDQMPTEIYGMARSDVVQGLERVKKFNDSSMYRCQGAK